MLYNNATQIKRDILYRVTKALLNSDYKELDYIPYKAAPRGKENIRCCIHKDRAILKYRVMAALGYGIEEEVDETKRLSEYAEDAGDKIDPYLTIIKDACSSCSIGGYYISDVCVGCVARPCSKICPREAITIVKGRSIIDSDLCVNCGKCQDACPYSAVVKIKVPCEDSCPVGALKKDENGIAVIDNSKCIVCGKCAKKCPFGAITDKSQIKPILEKLLDKDTKVNGLIAPSIAGQFPGKLSQIVSMLEEIGFSKVVHVGNYAERVAEMEAEEYTLEGRLITSSCCPSYTLCSEKHAKPVSPYLSKSPSPMELAGRDNPQGINVFIGPCFAKKVEGLKSEVIDYVITFEELGALAMAMELESLNYEKSDLDVSKDGYNFARVGGVTRGVISKLRDRGVWITPETINGIDKAAVKKFKVFEKLNKNYEFLEVMACEGGCLEGPGNIAPGKVSSKALDALIKEN